MGVMGLWAVGFFFSFSCFLSSSETGGEVLLGEWGLDWYYLVLLRSLYRVDYEDRIFGL